MKVDVVVIVAVIALGRGASPTHLGQHRDRAKEQCLAGLDFLFVVSTLNPANVKHEEVEGIVDAVANVIMKELSARGYLAVGRCGPLRL